MRIVKWLCFWHDFQAMPETPTSELLTRGEVLRRLRALGATVGKLNHWEVTKQWIARARKVRGRVYYRPEDVDRLERELRAQGRRVPSRARARGELAARAFALYQDGATVADVVVALAIEPETAYALRAYWSPADLVITGALRLELERLAHELGVELVGPVELVALMRSLSAHVRVCELGRIREPQRSLGSTRSSTKRKARSA